MLMYACGSRSKCTPTIVKVLLGASADARARDSSGVSPLMVAAELGSVDVAEVLLGMGADLFAVAKGQEPSPGQMGLTSRRVYDTLVQGKRYDPVLNYTERQRAADLAEAERALQEQKEVIDEVDLHEAETAELSGTAEIPSTPTILLGGLLQDYEGSSEEASEIHDDFYDYGQGKYFLSRVAPLRPQDLARPPPTGAARQEHERKAQALRRVGPAFDGSCDTALVVAARGGHTEFCKLLLRRGADASAEDGKGESALEVAAHAGHYKTCEALLAGRPPAPGAHARALAAAEAVGFQEVAMLLRGYKHPEPSV